MPQFSVTRRTAHAAEEMCELVADVERYPEFLPLCEKLTLRSRVREKGKEIVAADMTVGYRALRETFSTRVTIDRKARVVGFTYVTGPFRRLVGEWRFEPQGPRDTLVYFSIDYELRSRVLAALMGAVFDRAFRRFAEAFEARADAVYGVAV